MTSSSKFSQFLLWVFLLHLSEIQIITERPKSNWIYNKALHSYIIVRGAFQGKTQFSSDIFIRNWVFGTNSDFIITISLQPNVVDLRYFKLWIIYVISNSLSLKYQEFPTFDSQDIGIRKFEFVAKTQFLCVSWFLGPLLLFK